jgi:hypothetical protein
VARANYSLGLRSEHYEPLGSGFRYALGYCSGEAWTPQVAQAWDNVISIFVLVAVTTTVTAAEESEHSPVSEADQYAQLLAFRAAAQPPAALTMPTLSPTPRSRAAVFADDDDALLDSSEAEPVLTLPTTATTAAAATATTAAAHSGRGSVDLDAMDDYDEEEEERAAAAASAATLDAEAMTPRNPLGSAAAVTAAAAAASGNTTRHKRGKTWLSSRPVWSDGEEPEADAESSTTSAAATAAATTAAAATAAAAAALATAAASLAGSPETVRGKRASTNQDQPRVPAMANGFGNGLLRGTHMKRSVTYRLCCLVCTVLLLLRVSYAHTSTRCVHHVARCNGGEAASTQAYSVYINRARCNRTSLQ